MRFLFSFVVQLFCHNSPSAHVLALAQSASSAEFSVLYLSFMYLKVFNSPSLYRAVAKYCGFFRAEFLKTHKFLQLSGRFGNQSSGSEIINICHCLSQHVPVADISNQFLYFFLFEWGYIFRIIFNTEL